MKQKQTLITRLAGSHRSIASRLLLLTLLLFTTTAQAILTQTIELTAGWNWVSFNVETTLDDLKAALVEAGVGLGTIINSQSSGSTTYNGIRWRGQLESLDLSQMYKITIASPCEITLEGMPINPEDHPVTIGAKAANWIAFPFSESRTIINTFAGFAVNGDQVKGKNAATTYNGTNWRGNLNTLVPGQGYIYISNAIQNRTFIFPVNTK